HGASAASGVSGLGVAPRPARLLRSLRSLRARLLSLLAPLAPSAAPFSTCGEDNSNHFTSPRHYTRVWTTRADPVADEPLHALVERLRQSSAAESCGLSDGELLKRFLARRDEAAFEVLVWRHAGTVLGVCRRALGPGPDAEDAFQATFLILVKQARSIRRDDIGGWLHRVAYRVALRCRADRSRRRRHEQPGAAVEPAGRTPPDHETGVALDDAVQRLPERFRTVVLMCYAQGYTVAETAQRLGLPRGTVLSRLATARRKLKPRLLRQGLAPVALAALAVQSADAGPLVRAMSAMSLSLLTEPASAAIPAHVVTLAYGAIRTMFLNKIKMMALIGCAFVILGIPAGWLAWMPATPSPVAAADPPAKPSAPAETPAALPAKIRDLPAQKIEAGDSEFKRLKKERFNAARDQWIFLENRRNLDLDLPHTLGQMLSAHRSFADAAAQLTADPKQEMAMRELFLKAAKELGRVDSR
ncbi:MAG: RNA polymerase sigma factor, partial [Gemmataceae bacterium]